MGAGYIEQLEGILTPEQFAALPGVQQYVERPQAQKKERKAPPSDAEMREKLRAKAGKSSGLRSLGGKSRDDGN